MATATTRTDHPRIEKKRCPGCGKPKAVSEFSWKNKKAGLRQSRCKVCVRSDQRDRYTSSPGSYIARAAQNNAAYIERNREFARAYLSKCVCTDCDASGHDTELVAYSGDTAGENLAVWRTVNTARSTAAVLAALKASTIVCSSCLHIRVARHNAYIHLNHEQRDEIAWRRSDEKAVKSIKKKHRRH